MLSAERLVAFYNVLFQPSSFPGMPGYCLPLGRPCGAHPGPRSTALAIAYSLQHVSVSEDQTDEDGRIRWSVSHMVLGSYFPEKHCDFPGLVVRCRWSASAQVHIYQGQRSALLPHSLTFSTMPSSILESLDSVPTWAILAGGATAVLFGMYLFPYLVTYSSLRDIPGPTLAKFSHVWLFKVQKSGHRSLTVDELHRKHGTFVRLQPDHISIAADVAIKPIYGHTAGLVKSEFYDSFATAARNLFNVRNKADHTRKRKMMAHGFALRTVQEFEPYMAEILQQFVKQWDRLVDEAASRNMGKCASRPQL